jgi:hypothetical protein
MIFISLRLKNPSAEEGSRDLLAGLDPQKISDETKGGLSFTLPDGSTREYIGEWQRVVVAEVAQFFSATRLEAAIAELESCDGPDVVYVGSYGGVLYFVPQGEAVDYLAQCGEEGVAAHWDA